MLSNMKEKTLEEEQDFLDKIQFWLARTTEPIKWWDWDGNELRIKNGRRIEVYTYPDLLKILD